ncbi:hypothetical protein ABG067_007040 [Albugo candida]
MLGSISMLFAGKDSQHNMQPPDTQRFPGDKNQDGMPLVPAKAVMQATEDTENGFTSTEGITEPGCCAPLLRVPLPQLEKRFHPQIPAMISHVNRQNTI